MAGQPSYGEISDGDFADLLRALSSSAKGRSFLSEYRRRSQPEEAGVLLNALERIETTIDDTRAELKPERIADELRRIAMTLEIAAEGAISDETGDETARRMALVGRARLELAMLAGSLAARAD